MRWFFPGRRAQGSLAIPVVAEVRTAGQPSTTIRVIGSTATSSILRFTMRVFRETASASSAPVPTSRRAATLGRMVKSTRPSAWGPASDGHCHLDGLCVGSPISFWRRRRDRRLDLTGHKRGCSAFQLDHQNLPERLSPGRLATAGSPRADSQGSRHARRIHRGRGRACLRALVRSSFWVEAHALVRATGSSGSAVSAPNAAVSQRSQDGIAVGTRCNAGAIASKLCRLACVRRRRAWCSAERGIDRVSISLRQSIRMISSTCASIWQSGSERLGICCAGSSDIWTRCFRLKRMWDRAVQRKSAGAAADGDVSFAGRGHLGDDINDPSEDNKVPNIPKPNSGNDSATPIRWAPAGFRCHHCGGIATEAAEVAGLDDFDKCCIA